MKVYLGCVKHKRDTVKVIGSVNLFLNNLFQRNEREKKKRTRRICFVKYSFTSIVYRRSVGYGVVGYARLVRRPNCTCAGLLLLPSSIVVRLVTLKWEFVGHNTRVPVFFTLFRRPLFRRCKYKGRYKDKCGKLESSETRNHLVKGTRQMSSNQFNNS